MMQGNELKKEALRLGWINAESLEHLKNNYGSQDISAYGFRDGYVAGHEGVATLVNELNRDVAYWKLEAHAKFQEVEKLKTLIVKIIPFANALCTKCLPGDYDLSVYDEIKKFQTPYMPTK